MTIFHLDIKVVINLIYDMFMQMTVYIGVLPLSASLGMSPVLELNASAASFIWILLWMAMIVRRYLDF